MSIHNLSGFEPELHQGVLRWLGLIYRHCCTNVTAYNYRGAEGTNRVRDRTVEGS